MIEAEANIDTYTLKGMDGKRIVMSDFLQMVSSKRIYLAEYISLNYFLMDSLFHPKK